MAAFTIRTYRPEDLPRICAITIEGFDGVSIDRNIESQFGPVGGRDWAARKARSVEFDDGRRQAARVQVAFDHVLPVQEEDVILTVDADATQPAEDPAIGQRLWPRRIDLKPGSGGLRQ